MAPVQGFGLIKKMLFANIFAKAFKGEPGIRFRMYGFGLTQ